MVRRPARGPGARRLVVGHAAQGSDDSNTSYDAADSNQDGTVSLQEQQAYDDAQAEADTTSTSTVSENTLAALQTYRSVQSA